jgi:hypothetical protein
MAISYRKVGITLAFLAAVLLLAAFESPCLVLAQTQEAGSCQIAPLGLGTQRTQRDSRGRLIQLVDCDAKGNITHRQTYNYAPRHGSLEIIDYYADGTVERTLHEGGPNSFPWRVFYYRGVSDLDTIIEYRPVRVLRGGRRVWQEWIIYESGRWLKRPIFARQSY